MPPDPRPAPAVAVYLRCYPYDSWQMGPHLRALEEHAAALDRTVAHVFLDNGVSSRAFRPQLQRLLAWAARGRIDTVLVPGLWVFSLDTTTAHCVTGFLHAAGADVLELPERRGGGTRPVPGLVRQRERVPGAA
ncbi:recombinase family protein [Kitasatospora sp. NPDC052868]|uniref:recombinase family protein n=1 Tax=Kitasatospora sp. NPDC052868 TaxID=3364060 RepID=UPI0037CA62D8